MSIVPDLFGNTDVHVATGAQRYAQVALEQGIDASGGLTYGVPESMLDLGVGERVLVPLGRGNRKVAGFVIDVADEAAAGVNTEKVKWIAAREKTRTTLPGDLVELAKWIASYYVAPLGMVFAAMLPAAVKKGTGAKNRTLVRLKPADPASAGDSEPSASTPPGPRALTAAPKLTKLQKTIIEHASHRRGAADEWIELRELADLAGAKTAGPVRQLIERGILETKRHEVVVSDLDLRASQEATRPEPLALNAGQQNALDHLTAHLDRGFSVHLLHGVTGSGKTEVYLRLIEKLMESQVPSPESRVGAVTGDAGRGTRDAASVIVLVPEIALTPQTVARFFGRFDPSMVAVLHSGLTAAQRHQQWRRIHKGEARIVVGARSAIFAPVPNLRLLIVDEEHEGSYKQDQVPRYHARDVAIKRAQRCGVPVVLGSATPSLESWANAQGVPSPESRVPARSDDAGQGTRDAGHRRSRYHLLSLPERAPGMKLPHVEIVDLIKERHARKGVHLISQRLEFELRRVLGYDILATVTPGSARPERKPKGQAILLLNRRGYANYIACPDQRCGWMMGCTFCDTTVVYHKDGKLPTGGLVRCHHCDAEQLLPPSCPVCGKKTSIFGLGTQRVEEEIEKKFPGVRLARMDSDSMRSGRDYQETLDEFRAGKLDLLLGTQMIAKGLDFPGVRLVGVISGDTSLHMPDFRAAERTFQLIAQVSGRAGRSEEPGKVIVQTFSPQDPAITLAAQHDYETFARQELKLRTDVGLPPATRMARIVVRDKDHVAATARARELADHLAAYNAELGNKVRLRGPAPCPIARVAEFYRLQIELIAPDAATLQRLMTALRNTKLLISDMHTAVDVDPVALL